MAMGNWCFFSPLSVKLKRATHLFSINLRFEVCCTSPWHFHAGEQFFGAGDATAPQQIFGVFYKERKFRSFLKCTFQGWWNMLSGGVLSNVKTYWKVVSLLGWFITSDYFFLCRRFQGWYKHFPHLIMQALHGCFYIRRKFRSLTSDNMDSWKAE